MPRFTYVALDARGQESTGLVEAHSSNEAIGQLRQAGYFPTSVYEEGRASGPDGKVARATAKAIRAAKPRQRKNIVLFQRQKIKPKTLMIFTRQLAILTFLLIFIVPKFEAIFHDMLGDKPLPTITLFVIGVSSFVKNHGFILLGSIIAAVAVYKLIARTRLGRSAIDRFQLRLPLVGDVIRKTAISRFSRTHRRHNRDRSLHAAHQHHSGLAAAKLSMGPAQRLSILRARSPHSAEAAAFTLIELLVVIAIIVILAGLILSTVGYVQKKGTRARVETEIAALSAALESYKADNGIYPRNPDTDALAPNSDPAGGDPTQ